MDTKCKKDKILDMTSKLVALTMAVTFGASAEMTDADERHYQCISDYSLFRPLGWKQPNTKPQYRLLGTKVVGDDAKTGTWAYMSQSNDWGVVTVIKEGVEFAGSIVKEITNRKVVMENGDVYRQSAVEFLDNTTNKRKSNATRSESKNDGTARSSRRSQQEPTQRSERMSRGQGRSRGRQGNARWQEQIEKFQKATPAERSRMIEEFRSNRNR